MINPTNNNIIAEENPILWLFVKKVIVLTNKGPKKEVNFPDVANKPNPLPWLFLFNIDVITTRLADCIGPIKKPLIAARKKYVDAENVNKIATDENIRPIKERIITILDPYLSLAHPPTNAPVNAVIFIRIESFKRSFISRLNTPTANIPPITIIAFQPSA